VICLLLTIICWCSVIFFSKSSSSINPILGDFEKSIPLHKETISSVEFFYKLQIIFIQELALSLFHHFARPASTRFSASYLTLRCLNDSKGTLIRMFISEQWKSMIFSKSNDRVFVENQIRDKGFGENIIHCLKQFTEEYNRGWIRWTETVDEFTQETMKPVEGAVSVAVADNILRRQRSRWQSRVWETDRERRKEYVLALNRDKDVVR